MIVTDADTKISSILMMLVQPVEVTALFPSEIKAIKENYEYPIRGMRLVRWRVSIIIHRFACWVGGWEKHVKDLEYDDFYKEWFCQRCGWIPTR